jgi:hypothetical protein
MTSVDGTAGRSEPTVTPLDTTPDAFSLERSGTLTFQVLADEYEGRPAPAQAGHPLSRQEEPLDLLSARAATRGKLGPGREPSLHLLPKQTPTWLAPIACFDPVDSSTRSSPAPSFVGFRIVAPAATGLRLLLWPAADLKQQCARDLNQLAT